MRNALFILAQRHWKPAAVAVLLAFVSGEARGETPRANQWRYSYPEMAPAYGYDYDRILNRTMTMTPRQRQRIGHWAQKAVINEHQLRNTEAFYLKKLMRDEFVQMKKGSPRQRPQEWREESPYVPGQPATQEPRQGEQGSPQQDVLQKREPGVGVRERNRGSLSELRQKQRLLMTLVARGVLDPSALQHVPASDATTGAAGR